MQLKRKLNNNVFGWDAFLNYKYAWRDQYFTSPLRPRSPATIHRLWPKIVRVKIIYLVVCNVYRYIIIIICARVSDNVYYTLFSDLSVARPLPVARVVIFTGRPRFPKVLYCHDPSHDRKRLLRYLLSISLERLKKTIYNHAIVNLMKKYFFLRVLSNCFHVIKTINRDVKIE